MKRLIILAALCIAFNLVKTTAVAQVKYALFYDSLMNVVEDKKAARFAEVIELEDERSHQGVISLYKILEDSSSTVLVKKGSYASVLYPRKANGQVVSYFESGKRESVSTFIDGVQDGIEVKWHANGNLRHSIGFKKGKYHGELKTYYSNGQLKREELYEEGKQIKGICYNENGEEVAFVPYWEPPLFPGGETQMLRYLAQHLRYPALSQRLGEQGIVALGFIVDKNGKIGKISVLRSISANLDNEAVRVVKSMPAWKPGIVEGEEKDMHYILPVKFTIR